VVRCAPKGGKKKRDMDGKKNLISFELASGSCMGGGGGRGWREERRSCSLFLTHTLTIPGGGRSEGPRGSRCSKDKKRQKRGKGKKGERRNTRRCCLFVRTVAAASQKRKGGGKEGKHHHPRRKKKKKKRGGGKKKGDKKGLAFPCTLPCLHVSRGKGERKKGKKRRKKVRPKVAPSALLQGDALWVRKGRK